MHCTYTYTEDGTLLTVSGAGTGNGVSPCAYVYTYDEHGNVVVWDRDSNCDGTVDTTYTFTYTYDADGRLLSADDVTYTYTEC